MKTMNIQKSNVIRIAVGVIVIILVSAVLFLLSARDDSQKRLADMVGRIGKHMVLPTNETPVLAEVADRSKLQGTLKRKAETGDQILVYQKAGTAIIYRPSIDRVVSVEPILIGKQPNSAFNEKVAIVNGTGNEALLTKFVSDLYEKYPNSRLISKTDAPREFPTTIVYGKEAGDNLSPEVADGLGIEAGQQPQGIFTVEDATLTFIVGIDYGKK